MKQWIPSLILNAAVAFAVFQLTSMYYNAKYLRYIEDYKALRIVHAQLIQDSETLQRETRAVLGELKEVLSK